MPRPAKRIRAKLDNYTIREIQRRLAAGDMQHDIAADLGIDQGRISKVNTGKRRPDNDNDAPTLIWSDFDRRLA